MKNFPRDEELLIAFGKHLRSLREKQNISQAKLAYKIQSYQSTILRIEKGRNNPSLNILAAIGNALDLSLKELMDFEVKRRIKSN